jgi:hypothetical protein
LTAQPCSASGSSKQSAAFHQEEKHTPDLAPDSKPLKKKSAGHGKRAHREVALGGRHPEVGAAGVEDDGELLRGRADADLPKVLRVHVVLERDDVALVARAKGVGAAEARPLLGGEARGDAAVLVDRALLQRDPHQPLGRGRGEGGLEEHGREERQRGAAGSHGRAICSGSEGKRRGLNLGRSDRTDPSAGKAVEQNTSKCSW